MATGEGVNIKCGQCGSNINLMPEWYKGKRVWTIECPKCSTRIELTKEVSDRLISLYIEDKDKQKAEERENKDARKMDKKLEKVQAQQAKREREERERRRSEAMAKGGAVISGGNTSSSGSDNYLTNPTSTETALVFLGYITMLLGSVGSIFSAGILVNQGMPTGIVALVAAVQILTGILCGVFCFAANLILEYLRRSVRCHELNRQASK